MSENKLEQQLKEVGSKLEAPPSTKDALVKLLKQAATCLSELEQSPPASMLEAMQPFLNAIVKPVLLKHQDKDVRLLVATCICEITRITAPEAPYSDDVLKDIFQLIVGTFTGLKDTGGPSFGRRVVILETLAKYRSCVVMLDLECDDLVKEMFNTFFAVVSDDHPESVFSSMQTIMIVLLEESEEIQDDLLYFILSVLGRKKNETARRLSMNVIEQCAGKLEAGIKQFLVSSMSGDSRPGDRQIDYHEVIYDVYHCAPQILSGVVPYLTGELLTDQLETRLKAVGLVGDLFALPGSANNEAFQPIFAEFLKRLTDRVVAVRMFVLEHVKNCLLSDPSRAEVPQILSALCDRLLDYDENVRKQVVAVICDVACRSLNSIPVETIKLVAERLRDKSVLVKKYAMERLAEVFRGYCMGPSNGSKSNNQNEFDWVPGKILRCFYDKDFRSDTIEYVLCGSLFPAEFLVKDRVIRWVTVFSGFDRVEMKALERIMEQKQRLQQEMQRYLSLRLMQQDGDTTEIQKKILFCFRIMSRSFAEPAKAEENFQILDQLKDANIWKILINLLDPNTSFRQACMSREELLKILGEKHRLYDFLSTLSVKCSYLLFSKEHVKEILLEVSVQKSSGNAQYTQSCMDILGIIARFSPSLLGGTEEELVNLLKDDNEIIKEGILHVLAKAGGTIREQLAVSASSVDLVLERLCLEGSRRQAKHAVHAIAAITKDDGLMSLSVLYKRLVDFLEEKTHLPAVLQSLGCIAQTAMPVFETRESEITEFIKTKILTCSNKLEDEKDASWDHRSELCLLKIYGLKTLVKSYLPVKDAHLRPGIDDLLGILKNMLTYGEISEDIESSSVDKAHLRLASAKAVLRLSKNWDHKIPVDVFHLTLRTPEISFPQAKKQFLGKVHQYIKDRLLDAKYACAFLFAITESKPLEFEEEKQNLADIIQMHHQMKARQISMQSDTNSSTAYPEFILPYLVHALAHQLCPDVDKCKDVKAFELVYRCLYFIISLLIHKEEDVKSEAGSKEKESISAVISIFHSIKCSEDIVDAAKSKNSHAISDLGLYITKRLVQKEDDLQEMISAVTLPSMLYKSYEKKEGDDSMASERQTWLADESILTHFESLKLETDKIVGSEHAKYEDLEDDEKEGNEVPLGKMIQRLKSQGTKAGKAKKKKSSPVEAKNTEHDVDILKMVREINLDNLGLSNKFESSNGHKHSPSKKLKLGPENQENKKRKTTDATSVPVPKRPRSSSAYSGLRSPRSSSKASLRGSENDLHQPGVSSFQSDETDDGMSDSEGKISMQKKRFKITKSGRSYSSKRKPKGSDSDHDDEANEVTEADEVDQKADVLMRTDEFNAISNSKSPTASTKKRKRRSIAGLAKCTTKNAGINIEDLIGHRIKVWWPLDKQFYQGTIKSYDPIKKKHVILYDDGDVEVLTLNRERWEVLDKGRKPGKKLKSNSSKRVSPKEVSPVQKNTISGGSNQNKKSTIVKRKRTPKKRSMDKPKHAPMSNFSEDEDGGETDISDSKPPPVSRVLKMHSDDSQDKETDAEDENATDREESVKEVRSFSQERHDDAEENLHHADKTDEDDKMDSEEKAAEDVGTASQDEKSDEDDKEAAESSKGSSQEGNEEGKPDSEVNQETNVEGSSPRNLEKSHDESPAPPDAEISDDEPLSNWKLKVGGRSGSRRVG